MHAYPGFTSQFESSVNDMGVDNKCNPLTGAGSY